MFKLFVFLFRLKLYYIVCPVKYSRKTLSKKIGESLRGVCKEIGKRYEINFAELEVGEDHLPVLLQIIPRQSPKKIARRLAAM